MNDRLIFLESFLEELYDEHVDSFTYIMEQPRSSWESMLSMTNEMYDRMQEYVNGYMYEFDMPKDFRYAVTQKLPVLLVPEYSPRSIYDVCKQATDVVDILEQRKEMKEKKTQQLSKQVTGVLNSTKDIEHFIY